LLRVEGLGNGDARAHSLCGLSLLAFGLRTLIQLRRTGSTGFHGLGGRPGSPEWIAGVGFTVALMVGAAAPVLALLDVVEPISALDTAAAHVAGLVLAVGGIGLTFYAQVAMGASWRIGVDHEERTQLVTAGPFALIRNPIFAAMLPTALGLSMLVPSWVATAGLVGLMVPWSSRCGWSRSRICCEPTVIPTLDMPLEWGASCRGSAGCAGLADGCPARRVSDLGAPSQ
jgi:hypothetical protein